MADNVLLIYKSKILRMLLRCSLILMKGRFPLVFYVAVCVSMSRCLIQVEKSFLILYYLF